MFRKHVLIDYWENKCVNTATSKGVFKQKRHAADLIGIDFKLCYPYGWNVAKRLNEINIYTILPYSRDVMWCVSACLFVSRWITDDSYVSGSSSNNLAHTAAAVANNNHYWWLLFVRAVLEKCLRVVFVVQICFSHSPNRCHSTSIINMSPLTIPQHFFYLWFFCYHFFAGIMAF